MKRTAEEIVRELLTRLDSGDESSIDELMAVDMVNHAAAPQGREGWRQIVATIEHDLGPIRADHHTFIGTGDLVGLLAQVGAWPR